MKRVLITAGANGIGLVMARAFAEAGYRVWVTDVDKHGIAALPPGIRGTLTDASHEPAMELLFSEIAEDWGGLDVLCANAGIKGPTAAIDDMPLEGWHQCLGYLSSPKTHKSKHSIRLCPASSSGSRSDC